VAEAATAIALGLAIGLFSGTFGVGGSSIGTPLLRLVLGSPALIALGSPLPAALPTAVSGGIVYLREGLINVKAVLWTVLGGIPTIVLGSILTLWVPSRWLMFLVGFMVLLAGMQMLRTSPPERMAGTLRSRSLTWHNPSGPAFLALGACVGLLSGLLANGGGSLLVPAFVLLFGTTVREAAATSLPCVALMTIPGVVTHALLGHVDGWLALYLGLGVVPSTYLGASLSVRMSGVRLRRPFGALMGAFAVYFILRELSK